MGKTSIRGETLVQHHSLVGYSDYCRMLVLDENYSDLDQEGFKLVERNRHQQKT